MLLTFEKTSFHANPKDVSLVRDLLVASSTLNILLICTFHLENGLECLRIFETVPIQTCHSFGVHFCSKQY